VFSRFCETKRIFTCTGLLPKLRGDVFGLEVLTQHLHLGQLGVLSVKPLIQLGLLAQDVLEGRVQTHHHRKEFLLVIAFDRCILQNIVDHQEFLQEDGRLVDFGHVGVLVVPGDVEVD